MPYPIIDIEVTQPLHTLTISEEDTGIALVVLLKLDGLFAKLYHLQHRKLHN
ncbi:hypothetical protein QUB33_27320 [Microcoleus sp. B3-A4]|uniref:hypothetical protein n=1 Tax=Microcoleus sp. B3-A4 TaxID=2818653 RepID=UPI002FD5A2B4